MPFDPLSALVAGGGMLFDFFKGQQARGDAQRSQQYQMQQLAQALSDARSGQASAMRMAGGLRQDRFGNTTYYDPNQGRWITGYSPLQQRLIDEGQLRQRRAQTRGTQASQDYDTLRGEYLYRRPKTEDEAYNEIVNLIQQAQGTGERGLNTLMSRFGIRTAGNLPQLVQTDTGPSPGQQLAETMLRARSAALEESLKREQGHQSRYLPALRQFEETANYVAPLDPTGSEIQGMTMQGMKDMLGTQSEYDKLLANLSVTGNRNVLGAEQAMTAANKMGPGSSDFLNLAKMLMPGADKTAGTLGGTRGATASTSDGVGNWDHRFNFRMTNDPQKGAGMDAAPIGGADPRFGGGGAYDPFVSGTYGVPNYGDAGIFSAAGGNYLDPKYRTPWTF